MLGGVFVFFSFCALPATGTMPQFCICMCSILCSALIFQNHITSNTGWGARIFVYFVPCGLAAYGSEREREGVRVREGEGEREREMERRGMVYIYIHKFMFKLFILHVHTLIHVYLYMYIFEQNVKGYIYMWYAHTTVYT